MRIQNHSLLPLIIIVAAKENIAAKCNCTKIFSMCLIAVRCMHCFEWYNTLCPLNVIQNFRPGERFKQQVSPLDHFHHTDPVNCINTRCPWIMIEYTCRRHGSRNTQRFVHHMITGVTKDSFFLPLDSVVQCRDSMWVSESNNWLIPYLGRCDMVVCLGINVNGRQPT